MGCPQGAIPFSTLAAYCAVSLILRDLETGALAMGHEVDFVPPDLILSHQLDQGHDVKAEISDTPRKAPSELQLAGTGIIRFYQLFISSQDKPSCNFTPSCSRFTTEIIKRGGLLKGIMLGADRLTRCHNCTYKKYHMWYGIDRTTYHLTDPVDRYLKPQNHE